MCKTVISEKTIVSQFQKISNEYGEKTALVYNNQPYSYKKVDTLSDEVAKGLLTLCFPKGCHMAIWAEESANMIAAYFGILKAGGIPVLFNTSWTEYEVSHCIDVNDIDLLFFGDEYKNTDFYDIAQRIPKDALLKRIYIGEKHIKENKLDTFQSLCMEGSSIGNDVLKNSIMNIHETDVDAILFTSGTTSFPKGVETSNIGRLLCTQAQIDMLQATDLDIYCLAIPAFHCFSFTANVLSALLSGATLVIPQSRKTSHILQSIEGARCTVLSAVPTLYSALINSEEYGKRDISSLRVGIIGGSIYSEDFFRMVDEKLGFTLISSLGQTEATSAITGSLPTDSLLVRAATVGKFIKGIQGCIKDIDTGKILEGGHIGEICFKGFNAMKGYYNLPEANEKVFDKDGFIHTGDLGYLDENDNLHIAGRLKELIIRGGENIAPGELESVFFKDSRVKEVKVVGIPDTHYGEEICACIVPKQGEQITGEEIKELAKKYLAYYKTPKYVLFTTSFPLTGSGKLDTRAIKAWAVRQCLS